MNRVLALALSGIPLLFIFNPWLTLKYLSDRRHAEKARNLDSGSFSLGGLLEKTFDGKFFFGAYIVSLDMRLLKIIPFEF